MSIAADSFTGRVLAVLSRRSPAFRPPHHAGLAVPNRRRTSRRTPRIEQNEGKSHSEPISSTRPATPSNSGASITRQKAVFYRWHLENGGAVTWATHLAMHPEDAVLAVRTLSSAGAHEVRSHMAEISRIFTTHPAGDEEERRARESALASIKQILDRRLSESSMRSRVPEPRSEPTPDQIEAALQALDSMAGAPSYPGP